MRSRLRLPDLRSQKGVALLIALFAMTLMTFIAVEVSYDTSVDYVVASQQVNRIKAFYAAKAGLEISLLRIMLYKMAYAAVGSSLGQNRNMLDPIWQFPFMWPPTLGGTGKANEVDKDMLKEAISESLMQGQQYATTIMPEGGKLDINDIGSSVKLVREAMKKQLLAVFESEMQHNDDFKRKYGSERFEELVQNIQDYVYDGESATGGDKSGGYRDIDDKEIKMPPKRPLRTLDEMHQIAGMKDDFYKLLEPRVTVFGTKGINVNYAGKDTLMNIHPTMTEEAVTKVIARRNDVKIGGPFQNDDDFFNFISPYGVNIKEVKASGILLLYDMEFNFRIVSTGFSSNTKREITVIVYDYPNLKERMVKLMDKQKAQDENPAGTPPTPAPQPNPQDQGQAKKDENKIQASKGRPTIVYWEEN